MHVVVAGCGRVGARLADTLDGDGHVVVVVDHDTTAFRRLGSAFRGRRLRGVVFDRATLEEAGVKRAGALFAVTSGDNSNIVCARTARERYDVEHVVCRIYDPRRAEIFERLDLTVVASARWTADAMLRAARPPEDRVEGSIGGTARDVVWLTARVPAGVHGVAAHTAAEPGRTVLAAITAAGRTRVPAPGALLEGGDLVHLAVARDAVEAARARVAGLGG